MRKYLFTALLAGSAIASPALAQQNAPFTGFRIEGLVGYDELKSGERDNGVSTGDDDGDESLNGAAFGVGAGYDFDFGGFVAGIEGEFSESTGDQDFNETLDGINFRQRVEVGRDLYVGGRVGFRAAPRTLVYAKGGYTNTSIEGDMEGGNERFEFDTNVDGYRIGAGIEQMFGPNSYGKVEYRYSNYNNLDFSDDFDFDDFDAENMSRDIDLDRHQVMVGFGVRF